MEPTIKIMEKAETKDLIRQSLRFRYIGQCNIIRIVKRKYFKTSFQSMLKMSIELIT